MEYKVKIIDINEKEKELSRRTLTNFYQAKAEIYGTCIKLFTDNHEFKQMWIENFKPMLDMIRPHGRVFAYNTGQKMEVLYEPYTKTVIIKNCTYYGWIKSIALGLVNEYLEDIPSEHRRYSIHGSCIEKNGNAIGIIGPSGSGKTTLTYGLLLDRRFNFLTDDWFFVRLRKNGIRVFSSEKNSYIREGLEQNWPEFEKKIRHVKKDAFGRFLVDIKKIFSQDRIIEISNLNLIILLTRDKHLKPIKKLSRNEAIGFMKKNNFCNPHLLIKNVRKTGFRLKFFSELFSKVPVYLLNTIETPQESLARIVNIEKETEKL
ncbi:MAG: hypothetical protein WC501_03170 [Candidatus Micrarchaeia archaeon]|jgi:hypothetical protein